MSTGTAWLVETIQTHGIEFLFPLAILEGPIVSVVAGWLARLGYMPLVWTYLALVLADLIGDGLLYGFGRSGLGLLPERWRQSLGLTGARLAGLAAHFRADGGRTLIIAKLTHSLGFAALVAAGVARMPFGAFLWFNLLGTLPKTLFFVLIGYVLGQAHATIDNWIWRGSAFAAILVGVVALVWWVRRKREDA